MSWNMHMWAGFRASPSGDNRYIMKPSSVISSCCLAAGRGRRQHQDTQGTPPVQPQMLQSSLHLVLMSTCLPTGLDKVTSNPTRKVCYSVTLQMWQLSVELARSPTQDGTHSQEQQSPLIWEPRSIRHHDLGCVGPNPSVRPPPVSLSS